MAHRVYINASTQDKNVGVGIYGTEQDRMQFLADRIKYWLDTQKGQFNVLRNEPGWSLAQIVSHCNHMACELFIDNHSNAGTPEHTAGDGGAEGTEVYYYGQGGTTSNSYKFANILYKHIAPLSLGKDKGVLPDTNLYESGLYVIQYTDPPAVLIEHIFHTNYAEVDDFLKHVDDFAKGEAIAVCEFFRIQWVETCISSGGIHLVINGTDIDAQMDVKATMVNGRVLVPVRFLAEALGAQVAWDDKTKTITVTKK